MSVRKKTIKVFGLSIMAVLGTMALGVSSTHAAAFLENGSAITSKKTALNEPDALLQLIITTLDSEIHCANVEMLEGDLLGSGVGEEPGVGHVELLFFGCKGGTLSPTLATQPQCKLYPTAAARATGFNEGELTAKALVLVFLHSDGFPYVRAHGIGEEKVFSQIFTKDCNGLPNGAKIKGLEVFTITASSVDGKKLLFEMASLVLFPNELTFGINTAFAFGSIWVRLASNNPWSIC